MLDQNTDRMWFVIGAVIVGAAIISIANGTLPTLFASVSESFEESANKGTAVVSEMSPNTPYLIITPDELTVTKDATLVSYDSETDIWTIDINEGFRTLYSRGLRFDTERNVVPYGKRLTVSYDMYSEIETIAQTDINVYPLSIDDAWGASDSDLWHERQFNGEYVTIGVDHPETSAPHKEVLVPANTWTTVSYSFVNKHEGNIKQESLQDISHFGVRRLEENGQLRIQITNVRWELSDY